MFGLKGWANTTQKWQQTSEIHSSPDGLTPSRRRWSKKLLIQDQYFGLKGNCGIISRIMSLCKIPHSALMCSSFVVRVLVIENNTACVRDHDDAQKQGVDSIWCCMFGKMFLFCPLKDESQRILHKRQLEVSRLALAWNQGLESLCHLHSFLKNSASSM